MDIKQQQKDKQAAEIAIGWPTNPTTHPSGIITTGSTNPYFAQQSLPFSNGQASSMASKLLQQVKAEVAQYLAPKILNYLARNLACSCSDHQSDCPWGGNLKEIRSRLEDSLCAMELEDKLTL